MHYFVGFDNHFPVGPAMSSFDDEAAIYDVLAIARGCLEHCTEVHFVEPAIVDAFLEVRSQLKLPFPPRWPVASRRNACW